QIKDRMALAEKDNLMDAVTQFEATVREKDAELERLKREVGDTRQAARREESLMMSAWHDLGMQAQHRSLANMHHHLNLRGGGGDGGAASWLMQQRRLSRLKGDR
ncbi:hypothetical protein HK405_000752, partial [Cladochytrium tenue]